MKIENMQVERVIIRFDDILTIKYVNEMPEVFSKELSADIGEISDTNKTPSSLPKKYLNSYIIVGTKNGENHILDSTNFYDQDNCLLSEDEIKEERKRLNDVFNKTWLEVNDEGNFNSWLYCTQGNRMYEYD